MKLTNKEKNRISQLYSSKLSLNEYKINEFRDRVFQLLNERNLTDDPGADWEFEKVPIPFKNQNEVNIFVDWFRKHYPYNSKNLGLDSTYPTLNSSKLLDAWNLFDPKRAVINGVEVKPGYVRDRYKYTGSPQYVHNWGDIKDKKYQTLTASELNPVVKGVKEGKYFDDKEFYGKAPNDIRDYKWFENKKFLEFVKLNFAKVAIENKLFDSATFDRIVNNQQVIDGIKKLDNIGDEWYYYKARTLSQWRNELEKENWRVPSWVQNEIDLQSKKTFISQQGSKPKKMVDTEELSWYQKLNDAEKKAVHENLDTVRYVLGWISGIAGWIPHPIAQGIAYGADIARAYTYTIEEDNYSAGLEMLCVLTDIGIDIGMDKAVKYLKNRRDAGTLKKLGENIKLEESYGVNSLDLFTKGDMMVIDEIANSKNLQKIYDGMDQYQQNVIEQYLKDPTKFKDGYGMQKFLDTKKTTEFMRNQGRIGTENFRQKYWDDWYNRKIKLPGLTAGRIALQGSLHLGADIVWRTTYQEFLYRDEIDKQIKEKLHEYGISYGSAMTQFGGQVNNPLDVEKFQKAWSSDFFKSLEYGRPVKGWRPDAQNDLGRVGNTNIGKWPCEFYGSLKEDEWLKHCT